MLKYSTSLATLFGRSVCPLFLATALVVAPGVANAQEIIIDADTNETNGDVGTQNPTTGEWSGPNELTTDGGTMTVNEGVTMTIDTDGAGLIVDGSSLTAGFIFDVVVTNNGTIITSGTSGNAGTSDSAARSFGYADAIYVTHATNALLINNGLIDVDDASANGMWARYSDNANVINNGEINTRGTTNSALVLGFTDSGLIMNNGVVNMYGAAGRGMLAKWVQGATLVNNGSIFSYSVSDSRGMRLEAFDSTVAVTADAATTGHLMVNNGLIQAWKSSTNTGIRGMELAALQSVGTSLGTGYSGQDDYRYIIDSEMYNYGTINVIATWPPGDATNMRDIVGMYVNAHEVDVYNFGNIYIGSIGIGMEMRGSGLTQYNYGNIIIDAFNASPPTAANQNPISAGIESWLDRELLQYADPDDFNDPATPVVPGIERDISYRNKVVNAGLIQINNSQGEGLSAGIHLTGRSGHDVYNYGTIRTPNGWSLLLDADSLDGPGGPNYINLFDGSILVGDINVNPYSRDEYTFYLGDGYNAALRFDFNEPGKYLNRLVQGGPFPSTIYSPNGYAILGDMLFTVDLESYAQQDQTTWSMVSMIQDAIDNGTETRVPSGDFAFNGDGEAGLSNKWAQMFGGWVYDPGDGAVSVGDEATEERDGGFSGYSAGTIVGVNKPERSYFAGAAYSEVSSIEDMDNDTGYDTYSGTLFGGIATSLKERFNLSLTAGVSYNHTERDIADNRVLSGMDSVTANYASVFLSPSLLVEGPWGSSLRLNYLGGWTQSHSYELSGGERLEVESRYNQVFGARFQMAHDVPKISERLPIRVRYGAEASFAQGQDIDSVVENGRSFTGFFSPYNSLLNYQGLSTPYDDGFTAGGFAALDVGPAYFQAGYNTDEQLTLSAGLKVRF